MKLKFGFTATPLPKKLHPRHVLLLFFICWLAIPAVGHPVSRRQTLSPLSDTLAIGSRVPDLAFSNLINAPASSTRLSAFSGKLVILDFWASYCTPCIRLFPRFDSLQRQFSGRLQILLVTSESRVKAEATLRRQHCSLPSVSADVTLGKLFPHTSVPHEVWIYDHRVIHMSYGEDVNAVTINAALQGQPVGREAKQDNLAFDHLQPLFVGGNGGSGPVFFQSLITPFVPGLRTLQAFDPNEKRILSAGINLSILALYQQAFRHFDSGFQFANRVVLDVPDSIKAGLIRPASLSFHEWIRTNGYCYSLVLPPNYQGGIGNLMLADLNRFFLPYKGLSAARESRILPCLVLSRSSPAPGAQPDGREPELLDTDTLYQMTNFPMTVFLDYLAARLQSDSRPLVDETGQSGTVSVHLSGELHSLQGLQAALAQSGYRLKPAIRTVDMLVIRYAPLFNSPSTHP